MSVYKWLAEHYDEVFQAHLPAIDAARREMLGARLEKAGSACDLCCGTGTTAVHFAQRGMRVYGVDLSPGMCRAAREKVRRARVDVKILRADMRDFLLPEPVDLVTCECDALNHVPEKADLERVLECVGRALKPGGHFFFDVNNGAAFKEAWPRSMFIETPGKVMVTHGGCEGGAERAWVNVEWFIREGRLWRRRREHVEEVCWSAAEMRQALQQAGFGGIRSWDAAPYFGASMLVLPGHRTFWRVQKKG